MYDGNRICQKATNDSEQDLIGVDQEETPDTLRKSRVDEGAPLQQLELSVRTHPSYTECSKDCKSKLSRHTLTQSYLEVAEFDLVENSTTAEAEEVDAWA